VTPIDVTKARNHQNPVAIGNFAALDPIHERLRRELSLDGMISKEFNAAMLAEALCKLEGFRYEPSDSVFWMHGRSTESDFLYCTTQTLSVEQLNQLSEEVGSDRTLLVLCSAFRGKADRWPNLTVKKIPRAVQHKCEWGHDDYSLKVENLPKPPKKQRTSLFDDDDEADA